MPRLAHQSTPEQRAALEAQILAIPPIMRTREQRLALYRIDSANHNALARHLDRIARDRDAARSNRP